MFKFILLLFLIVGACEFRVAPEITYTWYEQPAVLYLSNNNIAYSWIGSDLSIASENRRFLRFRMYKSNGEPLNEPTTIDSTTDNRTSFLYRYISMTEIDDEKFAITYKYHLDLYVQWIIMCIIYNNGTIYKNRIIVSDTGQNNYGSVIMKQNNEILVTWMSALYNNSNYRNKYALFTSSGDKIGSYEIESEYKDTMGSFTQLPNNNLLLRWSRTYNNVSIYYSYIQLYTNDMKIINDPLLIGIRENTITSGENVHSVGNRIFITWMVNKRSYYQVFDNDLNIIKNATQIIDIVTNEISSPEISYDGKNIIISSTGVFSGWKFDVFKCTYDLDGNMIGECINVKCTSNSAYPSNVMCNPNGDCAYVWETDSVRNGINGSLCSRDLLITTNYLEINIGGIQNVTKNNIHSRIGCERDVMINYKIYNMSHIIFKVNGTITDTFSNYDIMRQLVTVEHDGVAFVPRYEITASFNNETTELSRAFVNFNGTYADEPEIMSDTIPRSYSSSNNEYSSNDGAYKSSNSDTSSRTCNDTKSSSSHTSDNTDENTKSSDSDFNKIKSSDNEYWNYVSPSSNIDQSDNTKKLAGWEIALIALSGTIVVSGSVSYATYFATKKYINKKYVNTMTIKKVEMT